MITLSATLMGMEKTGKTMIGKRLTSRYGLHTNLLTPPYKPTIAPDFSVMMIENEPEQVNIKVWDIPGDSVKKQMAIPFFFNSNFGLYCIDLSVVLTEEMLSKIKIEIDKYKRCSPDAQLILVGTKRDCALPNALQTAQNLLAEISFVRVISTSAGEKDGLQDLQDFLTMEGKKLIPRYERPYFPPQTIQPDNAILKARNRCRKDSDLHHALDHLNASMEYLNDATIEAIGDEVNILLDDLSNLSVADKANRINLFIEKSNERLQGKHQFLEKIILSVALTAAMTAIAAMIGFGIGFALGIWSGPGAFFTGLAAGSAAAVAVVGGASLFGTATLAYTSHRFFKTTLVQELINDVAEAADVNDLAQAY
ncbi:hypothetical protein TUM19329_17940 [Legionella antarctica]|uniref:Rho GTPase (Miro-like) n=1 Tax=Legionella antarctica TaxID=2708020 RepID=A0A6F8T5E9_9GAMM|nr:hypothetical protein [Legionella antarctica]BCA95433.1 hypothetical protein TUM19329_17940 [Legionella antarctica]